MNMLLLPTVFDWAFILEMHLNERNRSSAADWMRDGESDRDFVELRIFLDWTCSVQNIAEKI